MDKKMNFIGLGGAVAAIIGIFLPYVSFMGHGISLMDGISETSVLLRVLIMVAAAACTFLASFTPMAWANMAALGLSGAGFALIGYDFTQGMSVAGFGMYIALLGLVGMLAGGAMAMKAAKEEE